MILTVKKINGELIVTDCEEEPKEETVINGYTNDDFDELRNYVRLLDGEIPLILRNNNDLSFEDTIFKMNKIVMAAIHRRAKAKADELLSLNQWSVDVGKSNS